jgi:hypothetical protein
MSQNVEEKIEKTIGEKRVRLSFNPSNNELVDDIKLKSAELIDLCESMKDKDPRLVALAQTHYEDAAMWAVKAATTPEE